MTENREGLTHIEWDYAANFGVPHHRQVHLPEPWKNGEDPTEYAASWYDGIRMYERVWIETGSWTATSYLVLGFTTEGRPMMCRSADDSRRLRPMTDEEIDNHIGGK